MPFRQFVLKLHSRCDLACDHCYIYEHQDTQWMARPKAISAEVLARTALRIGEHARVHRLDRVHVVLHGGEPLLAGAGTIGLAAEELRAALPGGCDLDLRIHTNGVRLDRDFCELFVEHGIKVGISLDGDRTANDLHRRYLDGRSSHDKVLRAVGLLNEPRYRHLFAGLLCTIDIRNDPVAVYDALIALDPPRLDFLLPHATWTHPPPRPDGPESTPYADWLGAVYQRWDAQGRPVPVRTFDSVHRTLRGESSLSENLGLEPADLVVIDTDGTLEQADSLKTAFDNAAATGFNVFDDSFDTAALHPGMQDRQHGLDDLCLQCRSCPVVTSCGGGLYAHRYREGSGFDNPSVFCPDLLAFIGEVADRQRTAEPPEPTELPEPPLTERQFAELAAGYGGAATVSALVEQQLGIGRSLLAEVWSRAGSRDRADLRAVWELLTALDAEAPEAVDAVVAHPYTRAWAVRCLTGERSRPGADTGGLAEIAAAAALRAGCDAPVDVPVRDGVLRLPGLGRVLLPGGGSAVVTAEQDGFTVRSGQTLVRVGPEDGGTGNPRWQPVRRVVAGEDWTVALEDTDAQRDSYGDAHPVAGRLQEAEYTAWATALGEAWRFIGRALPGHVPGIAVGLASITPLSDRAARGRDISATARQAFGAVGIGRPATADSLALLIVHEFQHVKLGAVLDRHDLYDPHDTRLYYAPWRPDPRPLEGLLQGTYAHVAVAEYWRAQMGRLPRADVEFARWRAHAAEALETLAGSGSLTDEGARFVAGMRATVAPWLDEPISERSTREAERLRADTRESWLVGLARSPGAGG